MEVGTERNMLFVVNGAFEFIAGLTQVTSQVPSLKKYQPITLLPFEGSLSERSEIYAKLKAT